MTTPTTTAPAAKVGVFEFLEHHLPYKAKLLLPVAIIAGAVFTWNYVRGLEKQQAEDRKVIATLQQRYEELGKGSAVAGNQVETQKDVNAAAQKSVDPAVLAYMQQNGAVLQQLTQAVGMIEGRLSAIAAQPSSFAGKQEATTGALTGWPLEESRNGAPALTAVNLSYDPRQTNPNLAFRGTTWLHYTEKFAPVIGQWEKKKDGGYKTTIALSRAVYKPDPADPTKTILLGTEQIPITGAETIYGPEGIKADAFKLPRWTATFGFSRDPATAASNPRGYQPAALLDYRLTQRYGVTLGAVDKSAVLGLSIHFGKP